MSVDPTIVVLVPCTKSECIKPSYSEDSSSALRLRQRFLNALEVVDSIPRGEAAVWISNEDGSAPKSIDLDEVVVPLGKSGLTLENRGGHWTVVDSAHLPGHAPDR